MPTPTPTPKLGYVLFFACVNQIAGTALIKTASSIYVSSATKFVARLINGTASKQILLPVKNSRSGNRGLVSESCVDHLDDNLK